MFKELDIVEVVIAVKEFPEIEIGDIGTILMRYENGKAYDVECVLESGVTKWQCTLLPTQMKQISPE
ncbi:MULTISPECIES: DUF4926 domain-containing protein [Vibrio]|jgi:hypothetical protein|uniref:DUF4926 domain-containing protein n=1 Tax=Vibrio kanaloae TaxID=170673 RepID=A0ABV4LKP0_9VIBR|nr:DUF4926 domain-containing protein [Vibrio kanaloae]MCG9559925.1 DUF4926 domain-containing protein [Vibrio kanaloae]NOI03290.1 DUF4926 domain-containing protein [Vibrio kanaloae]OEF14294.1 DUF4926 domain-containing protein [Vibrio kanaloae 5S-149]UIJ43187.1 DUF4926 domain-containing protein [Vibrio kanaloae]